MSEIRKCPDCDKDFVASADTPTEEVCGPCYEAFSGVTIEELEQACLDARAPVSAGEAPR